MRTFLITSAVACFAFTCSDTKPRTVEPTPRTGGVATEEPALPTVNHFAVTTPPKTFDCPPIAGSSEHRAFAAAAGRSL